MAQGGTGPRYIGDYVVKEQIGFGSFSVVWSASHKIHGGEVAIKEIVTEKLSRKLQQSLVSEVAILKNINHPNIIRLHEFLQMPDRIYVVLEYCTGGDLAAYIQRHGSVSEAIAAHFMRQLAAGLQELRGNYLMHRDLKPQNLLLSTGDSNAVLKIADFGFARSLEPEELAETLCGSPLYMAPEIMQVQKYDAKADLWSVGAILYQLVTGQTPFSGNSQIQLLQNIVRSNELRFPPEAGDLQPSCIDLCRKLLRRNPVERLSFEEFFNHEFLVQTKLDSSPKLIRHKDPLNTNSPVLGGTPSSDTGESSHEECLTFDLDDDLHGHVGSTSFIVSHSSGFPESSVAAGRNPFSMNSSVAKKLYAGNTEIDVKQQFTGPSQGLQIQRQSEIGLFKPPLVDVEQEICDAPLSTVLDSLERIEQEYVLVPDTSTELSSSSHSPSGLVQLPGKVVGSPIRKLEKNPVVSAPMPIVGAALGSAGCVGSFGSHSSIPSGTSQGSIDSGDVLDQPSVHPPTRLRSLQQCAQAITELVNKKLVERKHLEALSIHLVCLAIWKEALHICHTWAASATEGSPSQDGIGNSDVLNKKQSAETADMSEEVHLQEAAAACSQMEDGFLLAVEHAEELDDYLEQLDASAEMPDAMEMIFQGALVSGRRGAVEELMGNMEKAVSMYSKSTKLLYFLLVEAPCLTLNPPFSLSSSDRNRLRRYIEMLTTREIQSRAHTGVLQESEGQQSI